MAKAKKIFLTISNIYVRNQYLLMDAGTLLAMMLKKNEQDK